MCRLNATRHGLLGQLQAAEDVTGAAVMRKKKKTREDADAARARWRWRRIQVERRRTVGDFSERRYCTNVFMWFVRQGLVSPCS